MLAPTRFAVLWVWAVFVVVVDNAGGQPVSRRQQERTLLTSAKALVDHRLHEEAFHLYAQFLNRFSDSKSAAGALKQLCQTYQDSFAHNRDTLVACLAQLANDDPDAPLARAVWSKIEDDELLGWLPGVAPKRIQAAKQQKFEVAFSKNRSWWSYNYIDDVPKYRLFYVPLPPVAAAIWWKSYGDPQDPWATYQRISKLPGPRRNWREISIRVERAKHVQHAGPGDFVAAPHATDWRELPTITSRIPVDEIHADLSQTGLYVLEQEIEGLRHLQTFKVEGFGIVCRRSKEQTVIWAVDPYSGQPLSEVDVSLANVAGDTVPSDDQLFDPSAVVSSLQRELGKTDTRGVLLADFELPATLVAKRGNEVQVCRIEETNWSSNHQSDVETDPRTASSTQINSRVYITTDRPIYRPGQTVHFKAVRRDYLDHRPQRAKRDPVRVEIRDVYGRVLHDRQHTWNAFGSLSGSFRLADEPRLGRYHVVVHVERPPADFIFDRGSSWEKYWSGSFLVEAYRKPQLRVTVHAAAVGDRMKAAIHAEYYIGGPVAGAAVTWSVSRPRVRRCPRLSADRTVSGSTRLVLSWAIPIRTWPIWMGSGLATSRSDCRRLRRDRPGWKARD